MVMSNKLLKEYVSLLVERVLLEIGTIGTSIGMSSVGTSSSSSTTNTTGAGSTESSTSTGGRTTKGDTDSSISNIEDMVKANSEEIDKNKKAINTAAHNMTTYTRNMKSYSDQTASGLKAASDASKNLAKPDQKPEDAAKFQNDQSKGLGDASSASKNTSGELQKTIATLQKLDGATRNG